MIIWQGHGYLVVLCLFVVALISNLVFDAYLGDGYYSDHPYAIAITLLLASAVVWGLARLLQASIERNTEILIDPKSGEEVVFAPAHSLFLLPVRFWPWLLLVIAVVLFGVEIF